MRIASTGERVGQAQERKGEMYHGFFRVRVDPLHCDMGNETRPDAEASRLRNQCAPLASSHQLGFLRIHSPVRSLHP